MQGEAPKNPFEAPSADPIVEPAARSPGGAVLAERGARLAASMIDTVIQVTIMLPLQYSMGVYDGFPRMHQLGVVQRVAWMAVGFALTLALNGYFLLTSAQSIGKKMIGIQIVDAIDDRPAPFSRIVLVRILPFWLTSAVPYVGPLASVADVLMIFRSDRRCVHDHIAGTRVVVKPPSG